MFRSTSLVAPAARSEFEDVARIGYTPHYHVNAGLGGGAWAGNKGDSAEKRSPPRNPQRLMLDPTPPTCALCGRPLLATYHIDYWGVTTCVEHARQYPHCEYCGRLTAPPPGRSRRRAGSVTCENCLAQAIDAVEQARPILEELAQWAAGQGVALSHWRFKLTLPERAAFARLAGRRPGRLGLTLSARTTHRDRPIRAVVQQVAILSGLPRPLFEGVGLHELAHVWLAQQTLLGLPEKEEEGFCELLAHRYYVERATHETLFYARRIAVNSDPIYGDGFRHLHHLVERVGFPSLLHTLRAKGRLPE